MDKFRLAIIIVNYKTPEMIYDALHSLESELDHSIDRVVIVDNFSGDGSVEKISQYINGNNWSGWVILESSPVNGGFSAGNNIGVKLVNAEFYLLLNSDAWVRPNALHLMLQSMERNSHAGLVGPRLEWGNTEQQVSCFNNMTPWTELLHLANTGPLTRILGILGIHEIAVPTSDNSDSPEWISFACVLIRKEVFGDIGLLDEDFFMYMEDIDFCRRARLAGWDVLFEKKARAVHSNKGLSQNKKIKRLPKFYYESRSRYFIKYYGRIGLLVANILWYLGRTISSTRELFQGRERRVPLGSYKDIWYGFWAKIEE